MANLRGSKFNLTIPLYNRFLASMKKSVISSPDYLLRDFSMTRMQKELAAPSFIHTQKRPSVDEFGYLGSQ